MPHNDQDLFLALGRLEGKVDILLAMRTDLDTRVRGLERWKAYALGVSAVISGLIAVVPGYLGLDLFKH